MVSLNLLFFILGVLSYFLYKKLKKRRIKYTRIDPFIENKIFKNSSEAILREQLNRNYLFFGEKGMSLIRNSCVLIINCENIGSHVAVTLARSGVKKLILIDNTKLNIDNYKYHPFATLEDINKDNLSLLNDYINKINPNTELILINNKINFENDKKIFSLCGHEKIDYILDCNNINNIIEKCKIINFSIRNNIKLISIYNLSVYQDDPTLIRHSRFSLLKNNNDFDNNNNNINNNNINNNINYNINNDIYNLFKKNYKKLYNSEKIPDFILIYSSQKKSEKNNFKENLFCYGVMSDSACSIILCDLAHFHFEKDQNIENILKNKNEQIISGKNLSEAIQEYKREEIDIKKCDQTLLDNLSYNDFRNICKAFKNGSCLQMKQLPKMKFIRWRTYRAPSKFNIVMMGKDEISKHVNIKNEDDLINFYGKNTVDRIDSILNNIRNN